MGLAMAAYRVLYWILIGLTKSADHPSRDCRITGSKYQPLSWALTPFFLGWVDGPGLKYGLW